MVRTVSGGGHEGWHGEYIALFAAAYSQPTFQFNSLIDLINDNPFSEGGLTYCTITPATALAPASSSCTGVQTRLNTSFVRINYAYNAAVANYNCLIASGRERFTRRGFLTVSYTLGHSLDDWQSRGSYQPLLGELAL